MRILKEFLGNVPKNSNGRLDRRMLAEQLGVCDKKVRQLYNNWRDRFSLQPESTLTFEQFLIKIQEAGISPYQIGCKRGQYQLARFDDKGPYTDNTCRFITEEQNREEQNTNSNPRKSPHFPVGHHHIIGYRSWKNRTCKVCGKRFVSIIKKEQHELHCK